jgi:TRAP-type mannitol/chloroaromatic compound transport system substrate-binding protein
MQTGELDGITWSGITEVYTAGWADVTKYYLTNNISGAWAGSCFANSDTWAALPQHLKTLFPLSMDSSHYYRQQWYWWGEAHYRTTGEKLELTTIPDEESSNRFPILCRRREMVSLFAHANRYAIPHQLLTQRGEDHLA